MTFSRNTGTFVDFWSSVTCILLEKESTKLQLNFSYEYTDSLQQQKIVPCGTEKHIPVPGEWVNFTVEVVRVWDAALSIDDNSNNVVVNIIRFVPCRSMLR